MSILLNLLLSLGFAAAVAGAIHVWRTQLETARREGMQALAARRGWALTVTGEGMGRVGTLRIVPRGGLPWIAEVRSKPGRRGFVTDYEAAEPRWLDGTLILIAAECDLADDADGGGSARRERALQDLLGSNLARMSGKLSLIEAPAGMTVLADVSPQLRVDLQGVGRALQGWSPMAQGARGVPVLILSPAGMQLRLRQGLKRPEQMERFLDLALDLGRLIGP
jgi:hypothetical protein